MTITRRYFGEAILLALLGACAAVDGTAWAASGGLGALPMFTTVNGKVIASYSTQSGLQVSVDTTWVGNRGYRPVQVTFSSAKPLTADTQITVRVHAGYWVGQGRSITVEQDLEMRQGASDALVTLLVPQYVDWDRYGWEVWVDGKKDKQLTASTTGFNQANVGNGQYAALVLQNKVKGALATQPIPTFPVEMDALAPSFSQLPKKWIGYTSLDMVIATPGKLERLKKNFPERLTEMLRWVRAGGNLWVFEVGEEYEQLVQAEASLGLNLEGSTYEQRGWRSLPLGSTRRGADALVMLDGRNETEPEDLAAGSRDWFVARAHGMGTITAFRKSCSELFPQDEELSTTGNPIMEAIEQSLLGERLSWSQRHGNDPGQENRGFNELLIPDVGAAPVFEFQLLISLFVIGIGPLNYWLLKRRGRLPLMLVTVPVAALVATSILFAYGILSDGFSVRVRTRSVTLLDQAAGEATCWARTSYYAGLAPAKGLTMPDDAVVYPIRPSHSSSYGYQYAQDQRELEWGKHQRLTRGWLASRTPTQYLSIVARASKKGLRFESQGDGLSVTNELGVGIVWLGVQDHDGKFYLGGEISAEGSGRLDPSEMIATLGELRLLLTENVLELPAGFMVTQRRGRYGQSLDNYPLSSNLMEAQINSVVSPLTFGWGDGTYVAITTAGPELSLGIEDAIESGSFHLVRGSWPNE